jgi:putative membrane protein
MMWNGYGMGTWGFGMMFGSSLTFLALLFGGVYLLYRLVQGDRGVTDQSADRLLAQRYARGEIDDQEYQHRLGVMHRR